jgi:hypothetical protein
VILKFYRPTFEKYHRFNLLSPSHPMLEMDEVEAAGGRSNNEVLHVAVTRENGDVAHVHFSVGINNSGQLFGEIVAMRGDEPARRCQRVAKWRTPVNLVVSEDVVEDA